MLWVCSTFNMFSLHRRTFKSVTFAKIHITRSLKWTYDLRSNLEMQGNTSKNRDSLLDGWGLKIPKPKAKKN